MDLVQAKPQTKEHRQDAVFFLAIINQIKFLGYIDGSQTYYHDNYQQRQKCDVG